MTIQANLADGRVLNFPDGTDQAVIQSTVKRVISSGSQEEIQQPSSLLETIKGIPETAATIATGVVAEPIAGLAGIVGSVLPGETGQGAEFVEKTREALTFKPISEPGKQTLGKLGEVLAPVGEVIEKVETGLGDFAFDLTGSPTVAAAAASTPTIVGELIGLKGLNKITKGTKLLDKAGRPTKILRKALDKEGLDFDLLNSEVRKSIPETARPGIIKPVRREVENVIKGQIESGARDDILATIKIKGGNVVNDKAGSAAVKQGFTPGFVQSIKTSSAATRAKMLKMTRTMKKIKKQERFALDSRPSDVVGDSVTERIKFIRDRADTARLELDKIARKDLPGLDVDSGEVISTMESSLDDLDIKLITDAKGRTKPDFKGSLIAKDRSSRRVITDLIDILGDGETPDALKMHKVKRQIDIMIDFNKKSAIGLSNAGKKVLKDVRRSINDSIRGESAAYANVNDILSESLTALGDLDDAVGTIDVFGKGANKAIGQKMRALLSNQQGRIKLENSLDQIESAAKNLGGNFSDDIKDLVIFADGLDSKFGTVAKTSLAGQTEQAITRAASVSPKATIVEGVASKIGAGAEKLRGINDFNAFEAIEGLLTK